MKRFLLVSLFMSYLLTISSIAQEDVLRPKGTKLYGQVQEQTQEQNFEKKPFTIGIEGGLNYNMFSQTLAWSSPVPQSLYNAFASGSGISPFFGILGDMPISNKVGIQLKLNYDKKVFSNKYQGIADCYLTDGQRIDADASWEYDNVVAYLSASLQLRYNFTDNFVGFIGPVFQSAIGDLEQTNTLVAISDGAYVIANGEKIYTFQSPPNKNPKSRIGLEVGAGYKFNIAKNIFLVPQARFQFMPTVIADDEVGGVDNTRINYGEPQLDGTNKVLHSLQFALALWFNL